jgi:copper chaperone NosL
VRVRALVVVLGCAVACGGGALGPVSLQPGTPCSHCRMTVLDQKLASQLLAPGEEPRFFDDLGCLTAYLAAHPPEPRARAFVADHVSGAWIDAARAAYSRSEATATPMGSHLVAHADTAARAADAPIRDAQPLTAGSVFGAAGPPGGTR